MTRSTTLDDVVNHGQLKDLSDEKAVNLFATQFRTELERLKNAVGTIESRDDKDEKTKGNLKSGSFQDLSPSRLIYGGEDFDEPNRTLLSFLALKWLVAKDYEKFAQFQPGPIKLKETSFAQLHELAMETLKDSSNLRALIVAIAVGDVGKDDELVRQVKEAGGKIENKNHDEIVYQAAEYDLLPALRLLGPQNSELRKDVVAGLEVGSQVNIPQLAQGENVPGSLKTLASTMRGKSRAFNIKFLEILLDVAGAGGQSDARAPTRMIEPVYQSFMTARKALIGIVDDGSSPRQAYDSVLIQRANDLAKAGFRQLSVEKDEDRALMRLFAMTRTATKDQADLVSESLDSLPQKTRSALIAGLNVDGCDDGDAILPYYTPAIFAECLKAVKKFDKNHQVAAIASCMRLLTKVYDGSKKQPNKEGRVIERSLSFAMDTVKDADFANRPEILDKVKLPWKK